MLEMNFGQKKQRFRVYFEMLFEIFSKMAIIFLLYLIVIYLLSKEKESVNNIFEPK